MGLMYRGIKRVRTREVQRLYRQGALLVVLVVLSSVIVSPGLDWPAGRFVSDTFAGTDLGSHWDPVTPHGVGAVQLASGTGQSWLALSVPAGVNHNPWTANEAIRAVQPVRDGDLHLQAGFGSLPVSRYQMQGLTVAASDSTFLRYEVRHDGAGRRLFASMTADGVPEVVTATDLPELDQVHLRVQREQDDWTFSWSADGAQWSAGTSFTRPMRVTEAGPFAGTFDAAGNAPAFTALVDYVVDGSGPAAPEPGPAAGDASPPSVSGPAVHTRSGSARLTWATDEVTTARVEYGPTDAYGEQSEATPAGLGHGRTLAGLDSAATYHYRIVATDLSGNVRTTEDGVFTTPEAGSANRFVSDSFGAPELAWHWRLVTPLGVGQVGQVSGAGEPGQLALSVPTGHNHHPWTVNDSVRAVQAVTDTDLGVEARFDSMPDQPGQLQGLTVGQSRTTFLRFGVRDDGSGPWLFASMTVDGSPTVVVDTRLPVLDGVGLRVEREQDDWVLSWSADGTSWTESAAFTQRMTVGEVGPFAGSHREEGAPPAFTALVGYVQDTADPSAGEPDAAGPPQVRDPSVDTATNQVLLRWATSETATTRVEYGTDDSYGARAEATTAGTLHRIQLTDLARGTTYHYRIVATDLAGQTTRTEDRTFTTGSANTGPTIDVWYGPEQVVNPQAQVQQWVNVLGNVSDADRVTSLNYSLNGGGSRPLTLGPDDRRLQWKGDFNADIAMDELRSGANTVTLTATDGQGLVTTSTVTVTKISGAGVALPYELAWRPGVSPAEQAQVVDGAWTMADEGLRIDATGYDRLVALGDIGWTDFQLTVPITVHELGPEAGSFLSGGPMIGVGLRWRGHTAVDERQPAWGYYPTGAFAWYRFHESGPRFELIGNEDSPSEYVTPVLELETTYLLKVRVETLDSGATRYQSRLWRADGVEPGFWQLEIEEDQGPESGAVALIAHQLHGTFGDVVVQPL